MKKGTESYLRELFDPASLSSTPAPVASLCWAEVLELAVSFHAETPIAAALSHAPWVGSLAPGDRIRIEDQVTRGRMALALLDEELEFAGGALRRSGIEALVLKGADLGRRFYPDRLLRPMADVDLLVASRDYLRAGEVLGRLGYRSVGVGYRGRFRAEYCREGLPVIELHTRLVEGDDEASVAGYFSRAEEGPFPAGIRALEATDLLSHLVRHGAVQHVVESPVWLWDIHFLLKKREIRWEAFTTDAIARKYRAAAWFLLAWLSERWGTPVDAAALERLGEGVGRMHREALRMIGEPRRLFGSRGFTWLACARWFLRDSAGDAVAYLISREKRKREERASGLRPHDRSEPRAAAAEA